MATIVATVNVGGGADYTSLNAARAALAQNLTGVTCDVNDALGAATIALQIRCAGSTVDTTACTFGAEFTTDATHRIQIIDNTGAAGPKWDTSRYRLSTAASFSASLVVGAALHMDIAIQVENTATLDNRPVALGISNFTSDVRVFGGFYRTTGTTGSTAGQVAGIRNIQTGLGSVQVWNSTLVSADGGGYYQSSNSTSGSIVRLYNVLCANRSANATPVLVTDSASGADTRFKNCILQGSGSALYTVAFAAADEKLTMLTQDATGTSGLTSKTLTFVDAANWDYHLASGDTNAIDVGTDLHADTYLAFAVDADGNARPNGAWDLGPHEYVNAATLDQSAFRFYNDDGNEAGATPAAAENTDLTAPAGQTRRIRMQVDATGDPATAQYQLEWRIAAGTWAKVVPSVSV